MDETRRNLDDGKLKKDAELRQICAPPPGGQQGAELRRGACAGAREAALQRWREQVQRHRGSPGADAQTGLTDSPFPHGHDPLMEKYLASPAQSDCPLGDTGDCGYWRDSADLDGSSEEEEEEGESGTALLVQQCRELASRLGEREAQLEALRHEARRSAQGLQEALGKGEELTRALEAERERRTQGEERGRRALQAELHLLRTRLGREERAAEEARGLVAELGQEKELLLAQLRGQEQLVREVQEQKLAGDSVSSEVQALFGRQLSVLQEQRDRAQGMLDLQQARSLTASRLLGQRTLGLDSALQQLQQLQARLAEREGREQGLAAEKQELESRLRHLQQRLAEAEQAVSAGLEERVGQEARGGALEIRARNAENALQTARSQLQERALELRGLTAEREAAASERRETEGALRAELERVREERRQQVATETLLQSEAEKLHRAHQEELGRLTEKHQQQVTELGEKQRKHIMLIKEVHEREHEREMAELAAQQEAELSRMGTELRDSLETAHQTELLQAQTQHALELEALRLSLTNQHAAQLELSQNALQQREEEALREQRENLSTGWSRDSSQLQAQQQAELEKLQQENRDRAQRADQQHRQEKDGLNREWETRLLKEKICMEEQQANQIEALRAQWQRESDQALQEVQTSREEELQRLQEELSRVRAEWREAARVNADLVAGHQGALQEQQDRARRLEERFSASAEREQQLQEQVERLQADHVTLKWSWEQEVGRLQNEQEGLREQLQAQAEEEEERMKRELSRERRELQEQKEAELERLRLHFTQRLRVAEESHREEVRLLQQQLAEGSSAPQEGNASFLWEGGVDEDQADMIAEINLKLEKHKEELASLRMQLEERHTQELGHLRASLALSHREELLQVKTHLAERYLSQTQELESRHAQELDQQRARLSDRHAKEIGRLRLQSAQDAARQVEREVQERSRAEAQQQGDRLRNTQEKVLDGQNGRATRLVWSAGQMLCCVCLFFLGKLKQEFAEQLRVEVLKAREQEGERVRHVISQEQEEALGRVKEELRSQAEAQLSALGQEVRALQEQLEEVRRRPRSPRDSPGSEQDPRLLAVRQKMEAQFQRELLTAKQLMAEEVKELNALLLEQGEAKLQEAQRRFEEERKELEQKRETALQELQSQNALLQERWAGLDPLRAELQAKHRAELDSQEAELLERSHAQLRAQEAELQREREELEARMLSNMDSLETALLREVEAARGERDGALLALRGHTAQLDGLRTQHQAQLGLLCIELRKELDLVLGAEPPSTASPAGPGQVSSLGSGTSRLQEEREGEPEKEQEEGPQETQFVDTGGLTRELGDLFSKLKADLRAAAEQRRGFQEAVGQLQEVLREVVSSTVATEEEIQRRLCTHEEPRGSCGEEARAVLPDPAPWSVLTDGGLSRSQRLSEGLFSGPRQEGQGQGQGQVLGQVLGVSARLRSAVDRLLDLLQVEWQLSQSREDSGQRRPLQQLDLLNGPAELSSVVNTAVEEVLQQKEVQELVQELEEQEAELLALREERALLLRQREALAGPLGDTERALLEEAQRLLREKGEVQRQAERHWGRLASRLRLMEEEVEERDSSRLQEEQEHKAQLEDLHLQVQALERQLRHHRQFIQEQGVEREQEREEFQQEIQGLEARLKRPSGAPPRGTEDKMEELVLQVEALQKALREKVEDHARLLLTKEKYRGDVSEQDEQIHTMAARIRELEQALLSTAQPSQALEQQGAPLRQLCPGCLRTDSLQGSPDEAWPPGGETDPSLSQQLGSLQAEVVMEMEQATEEELQEEVRVQEEVREEVQQLRSQVQHLLGDRARLQQGWEVEEERLQEVILRLQEELQLELSRAPWEETREGGEQRGGALRQREAELVNGRGAEPPVRLAGEGREDAGEQDRGPSGSQEQDRAQTHTLETGLGKSPLQEEVGRLRQEMTSQRALIRRLNSQLEEHRAVLIFAEETLAKAEGALRDNQAQLSLGREGPEALEAGQEGLEAEHVVLWAEHASLKEQCVAVREDLTAQTQRQLCPGCLRTDSLQGSPDEAWPPGGETDPSLSQQLGSLQAEVVMEMEQATEEELQEEVRVQEEVREEVQQLRSQVQHLLGDRARLQQGWEVEEERLQEVILRLQEELQLELSRAPWEETREGGEQRGGALRQREAELVNGRGAEPPVRLAGEGREDAGEQDRGPSGSQEQDRAQTHTLETGLGKSPLQEEVGRLRQEMTSQRALIRRLNSQLEEHRAVLIFAEETLAKAEGALRDNQAQLSLGREGPEALEAGQEGLEAEHVVLWAEHASLKEQCVAVREDLTAQTQTEDRALASEGPPSELHSPQRSDPCSPLSQDPSHPPEAWSTPFTPSTSTLDSPHSEQVQTLDDRYFTTLEDWPSEGDTHSEGFSLDLDTTLQGPMGNEQGLSGSFLWYLHTRDMAVEDPTNSATESMGQEEELLSTELQDLLRRVYREGHMVLSLSESERPVPVSMATPQAPPPGWQAERRALQQTVLSLRELLCKMAARERQAVLSCAGPQNLALLTEQLKKLLRQQEEQRRQHLEQLFCAERLSLFEEVQNLRSLLSTSSLRTQEQLRLLQTSLSAFHEEASQSWHEEPLEGRGTERLLGGAPRDSEQRAEPAGGAELSAQLPECVCSLRRCDAPTQTLQALQLSLEEQASQMLLLREEVQQERQESRRLRSEESHCHALIAQESLHAREAQRQLEEERELHARSLDQEAQRYKEVLRQLEEEKARHEEAASQDRRFMEELQVHLEQERARSEELAASSERLTRQAIRSQRQLEQEVQRRCQEETQREQEAMEHLLVQKLEQERRRADRLQTQLHLLRQEHRRGRRQEVLGETELQLTADIADQPFNSKLRRLYCKFLRAESYRKALVFQKRYLLLVLGGVPGRERSNLGPVGHIGACPSSVAPPPRPHPLTRFRTAALAAIAITRLALLVRKWRRAFRIDRSESEPHQGAGEKAPAAEPSRCPFSRTPFPPAAPSPAPVRHITLQPVAQVTSHLRSGSASLHTDSFKLQQRQLHNYTTAVQQTLKCWRTREGSSVPSAGVIT
ncbi:trichohyalin-like [Conger conger]|uniref:trichohyalin-like n=1 Tax=Conger conger TaxID=82655 RepID=UPI002A59BEA5|nr:trichohyalin-like [Conger conger]